MGKIDDTKRRVAAGLFFGILLLLGPLLVRDYGMGWDERADRMVGYMSLRYVAQLLAPQVLAAGHFAGIHELATHGDADHGPVFQMLLAGLEIAFFRHDPRGAGWMRHLLTFGVFVAGVWAVYRLGRARFASWRWGLVGAALLVLSPRIFAEAFYNYKDIVFLSLFALAVLTLTRLLHRPTVRGALLHALVCALATDVRTMGILLPGLTVAFGALEMWARPDRRAALVRAGMWYLGALAPLVVLFWPFLWEAPVARFWACFGSFRRYRQTMKVFYLGELISCQRLPWHYLSVWLLVTTPVAYTALALGGAWAALRGLLARPTAWLRHTTNRQDLLFGTWLLGPLSIIVAIQSVVYDGWRHVYFIYPALVLLAVRGLRAGVQAWQAAPPASAGRRVGWLTGGLLALGMAHAVFRQIHDHPYQYGYFSFLPGPTAQRLFERDYWGVSGRDGLAWVLAHDPGATVTVSDTLPQKITLHNNSLLLPAAQRARLRFVPHTQARYFLGIYRWHPGPYEAQFGTPVHDIQVNGMTILTVFRR
ncbi:ArnT family glycosyltransferase [Hymenobacter negativus]|uniref:Glycosyltransferase family 39 protein n=1 Tax=Hymenobacter negativus TaxID=2795026 RepID=A0ABS0Q5S6_9BACT|nr:glycosyltransferase family 39 protein [Hymenobacter negativus]MBH8558020.1 glycosyltransferase family 39 protein [Hymenobacter negativus]